MTRFRIALVRTALVGAAALWAPGTALAQPSQYALVSSASSPRPVNFAPVPFGIGEELVYKVTFGGITAGTARMHVAGLEEVRGRLAYHVVFSIEGGIPFFRVRDRYESWIDVETLSSLRHRQQISEGRYKRTTLYEIYPEQQKYRKNDEAPQASVANPLDEGSFIYAIRSAGVRVGETKRDDRYFRPDRNPVVLTGVRRETVKVDAGTYTATVVRPTIRTTGLFSEDGDAQIWFSADAARIPVQVKTKFSKFTLTMNLQSVKPGVPASQLDLAELGF